MFTKMNQRKYLAQWVQVVGSNSQDEGRVGVVMDEGYLHNGVLCCRVIVGKDVIAVEARCLKKIQV